MNSEAVCKAGYLNSRMKSSIRKKYKQFYAKLYRQSMAGVSRLELFTDEKSSVSGVPAFVIVAADVIKVAPHPALSTDEQHAFQISVKEQTNLFSAKTEQERDAWIKAIQSAFFQSSTNTAEAPTDGAVTSENDIYISADEVTREFLVTVGAESREKLGFDGTVRLLVEDGHVTLIGKAGNRLMRWGVEHLRRFGYRANDFHLEAGRKSQSGEGTFIFVTFQGKQIHTMVTKEKQRTRTSMNTGQPLPVPVGHVPNPGISTTPDITIGGHIYEEFDSFSKVIPNKPPRQKLVKSGYAEADPPELPKPISFASIKSPRTNGAGATPPEAEAMFPAAKSLASMQAEGRPRNPPGVIYCEPELHINAWRTHGRDVEDQPVMENTYDTLQHFQQNSITEENHYSNKKYPSWPQVDPQMLAECRAQQQQHQTRAAPRHVLVNNETIYAVVTKPPNRHGSGSSGDAPAKELKPGSVIQ